MKNLITKAVAVAGLTLTLAGAASGVVGDAPVVGVPAASAHGSCNEANGHSNYHWGTLHRDYWYAKSVTYPDYYTTKVVWLNAQHGNTQTVYCR